MMRLWMGIQSGLTRACLALMATLAMLLPAATLALAEEAAHEGGEAHHGNPWMDLLYKAINVAILLAIVYWAARKPVAAGLKSAAQSARNSFLSSRKAAQDLEAQMAEQKRKITALSQDLTRMVAEAKADVEREKQRAQADAQALAARLQEQALQQVEQELAKARNALRQDLADQTVKLAEQLIKQRMNPQEQQRLVADYLKRLEARA